MGLQGLVRLSVLGQNLGRGRAGPRGRSSAWTGAGSGKVGFLVLSKLGSHRGPVAAGSQETH